MAKKIKDADPETDEIEVKKPAKKKKKKKKKKSNVGWVIAGVLFCLIIISVAVGVLYVGAAVRSSDTILPNVYAGDVALGGLTKDEALQTLKDSGYEETVGGTLKVKLAEGIGFSLDYTEVGACPTLEYIADRAYSYGRSDSVIECFSNYIAALSSTIDVSSSDISIDETYIRQYVDAAADKFEEIMTADKDLVIDRDKSVITVVKGAGELYLDRDVICGLIKTALENHESTLEYTEIAGTPTKPDFEAIYEELAVEPQNATLDMETFEVTDEVIGVSFDVNAASAAWDSAQLLDKIEIPIEITYPSITGDDLRGRLFRDLLGEQTTYYWGSSGNRINNIQLAASKIDGTILMPGDVFSYNDTVGQRTKEAGFLAAGAYSNGQVVQEIGGGICQVSSTLYAAMLRANLETVSRTCHQFVVTYLPFGIDATVSWGKPDFKFANNTDYPIKIVATTNYEERSLTVQIWGTNLDGTYCEPTSVWWAVYDEEYTTTQVGWGARSYRNIYDANGNLIETIEEAYSSYDLHEDEIEWPPEYYGEEDPEDGTGGSEDWGDLGDSGDTGDTGDTPIDTPVDTPIDNPGDTPADSSGDSGISDDGLLG